MKNHLDSRIKRLLTSHGLFSFGRSAFELFMGVFIWRLTNSLQIISIFSIIYLITHTLMFVVFSGWMRKGRINLLRNLGLIGFTLAYLLFFYLGENARDYLYPLAVLLGISNGMYWLPYQLNRFDFTHIKNRGNYTGFEFSIKTFVSFAAPVVGGLIISSKESLSGYSTLFLLGSFFYILSMFVGSIKVEKRHLPKDPWHVSFFEIISHKNIRKILTTSLLGAMSINGALVRLVLPLLILKKTGTELELGGFLSLFAFMSILGSLFIGKILHYTKYNKSVVTGGVLYILVFSLLYFYPSLFVFIIFGAVQDVAANMINIPKRVYSENLLHKTKDYEENRVGYLVTREIFGIGIGRVMGYAFLYFATDLSMRQLSIFSIMIVLAVMLQVYLITSIKYAEVSFD